MQRAEQRRLPLHRVGERCTALHRRAHRLRRSADVDIEALRVRHTERTIERRASVEQRCDSSRPLRDGAPTRCRTEHRAHIRTGTRHHHLDRDRPELLTPKLAQRRVTRCRAQHAIDQRTGLRGSTVLKRCADLAHGRAHRSLSPSARTSSSGVVTPSRTSRHPSSRNETQPCRCAPARKMSGETPATMSARAASSGVKSS